MIQQKIHKIMNNYSQNKGYSEKNTAVSGLQQ